MKRIIFILVIIFTPISIVAVHAEDMVTSIDSLDIDLWPDYDRKSVLVLLTGTLHTKTLFPATVTLPFPETAQLNAVARIDSKDGRMYDDMLWVPGPGSLMFTTPDLRFRLEYYLPYKINGNQRSIDYTWLADLSVNKLRLRVQKPKSAISLQTEPPAENVVRDENGFDYHIIPQRSVPAGQPFKVLVNYDTISSQLSVQHPPVSRTSAQTRGTRSTSITDSSNNWPIVVIFMGVLLIVLVLVWHIATHRASANSSESLHKRIKEQSWNKFCHDCGEPVNEEDKFCSNCGIDL